ncbi:MAG: hypothetical protein K2X66_10060 [Cyanobacteria bacterium]|nr:hypothetical protein [Cyanobacteriota bacterium]
MSASPILSNPHHTFDVEMDANLTIQYHIPGIGSRYSQEQSLAFKVTSHANTIFIDLETLPPLGWVMSHLNFLWVSSQRRSLNQIISGLIQTKLEIQVRFHENIFVQLGQNQRSNILSSWFNIPFLEIKPIPILTAFLNLNNV